MIVEANGVLALVIWPKRLVVAVAPGHVRVFFFRAAASSGNQLSGLSGCRLSLSMLPDQATWPTSNAARGTGSWILPQLRE